MLLKFNYKNWKDEDHSYIIEPDIRNPTGALKFEDSHELADGPGWYVHGYCISRDGEIRQGCPRRSFRIEKMNDITEVAELT